MSQLDQNGKFMQSQKERQKALVVDTCWKMMHFSGAKGKHGEAIFFFSLFFDEG